MAFFLLPARPISTSARPSSANAFGKTGLSGSIYSAQACVSFFQTELVPGLLHIIFTGRTCMNENAGDDTEVECFDSPGSGESSRPPIPCPEGVLEERACLKSEPVLTQLL